MQSILQSYIGWKKKKKGKRKRKRKGKQNRKGNKKKTPKKDKLWYIWIQWQCRGGRTRRNLWHKKWLNVTQYNILDDEEELKQLWKKLSPPLPEESLVEKWYGATYHGKKKSHLYVGKAIRRFLEDANGPVQGMELDCLSPHVGTGTILVSVPALLQPSRHCDISNIRWTTWGHSLESGEVKHSSVHTFKGKIWKSCQYVIWIEKCSSLKLEINKYIYINYLGKYLDEHIFLYHTI